MGRSAYAEIELRLTLNTFAKHKRQGQQMLFSYFFVC